VTAEEDISRIKIKFLIEGLGEAEGEFVRFLAPRSVDTLVRKTTNRRQSRAVERRNLFRNPSENGRRKSQTNS